MVGHAGFVAETFNAYNTPLFDKVAFAFQASQQDILAKKIFVELLRVETFLLPLPKIKR